MAYSVKNNIVSQPSQLIGLSAPTHLQCAPLATFKEHNASTVATVLCNVSPQT